MAMAMVMVTATAKKNSNDCDRVQVMLAPDQVFLQSIAAKMIRSRKNHLQFHTKCDNIMIS